MQEMEERSVRSLGWEDPLEEGMATHSYILAWRIPWAEGLMGYSSWSCKELGTTEATHVHADWLVQKFNSILTLPPWRQSQILQVKGSVPDACIHTRVP